MNFLNMLRANILRDKELVVCTVKKRFIKEWLNICPILHIFHLAHGRLYFLANGHTCDNSIQGMKLTHSISVSYNTNKIK